MAVKVLQALRQLTGFSGGTVDGGVPKKPPTPAVEALVSVIEQDVTMKLDFYCPNFKAVSFQVMYNGSDKYYVIQIEVDAAHHKYVSVPVQIIPWPHGRPQVGQPTPYD